MANTINTTPIYISNSHKSTLLSKFLTIGMVAVVVPLLAIPAMSQYYELPRNLNIVDTINLVSVNATNNSIIGDTLEARELAFNVKFSRNQTNNNKDSLFQVENKNGEKDRIEVSALLKEQHIFENPQQFQSVMRNIEEHSKLDKEKKYDHITSEEVKIREKEIGPDVRNANFLTIKDSHGKTLTPFDINSLPQDPSITDTVKSKILEIRSKIDNSEIVKKLKIK